MIKLWIRSHTISRMERMMIQHGIIDKIPNILYKEWSSHKMTSRIGSREINVGLYQGSLIENMT
jgi:hypothetical protein